MAKAGTWDTSDADERKLGEQNRLDTCVVLAVNDAYQMLLPLRAEGEIPIDQAPNIKQIPSTKFKISNNANSFEFEYWSLDIVLNL